MPILCLEQQRKVWKMEPHPNSSVPSGVIVCPEKRRALHWNYSNRRDVIAVVLPKKKKKKNNSHIWGIFSDEASKCLT